MSTLENFVSPALTRALGWTLLHSLWQGALVAAVLAGALLLLRRQRAEVRYVASAGALGVVVALAGITFGLYLNAGVSPQARPAFDAWKVEAAKPARFEARAAAALPETPEASEARVTTGIATESARGMAAHQVVIPSFSRSWTTGLRYFDHHLPLLVLAWLLGLLAMSLRMLGGLLYVQRLRRHRVRPLSAAWQARLAALAQRSGVRRPVALLESALVQVPLVVGHLRPVILLPLGAVAGLSAACLEAILAHELAHVLRRDYLVNLLQTVAEVLFFYHPAVWFVASCVRTERENCCDDTATALCGNDPLRLARALTALAEWSQSAVVPANPRLALAALGGRGALLHRVRRLVQRRPAAPTLAEGLLAGTLVLGGLGLLGSSVALAGPLTRSAASTQNAPKAAGAGDAAKRITGYFTATSVSTDMEPANALGLANEQSRSTARAEADALVGDTIIVRGRAGRHNAGRRGRESRQVIINGREMAPFSFQQNPGTVVITKDKKGRLTDLVVNGQRVDAGNEKGKRKLKIKDKKGENINERQVEVIRVVPPNAPEVQGFVFRSDSEASQPFGRQMPRGFEFRTFPPQANMRFRNLNPNVQLNRSFRGLTPWSLDDAAGSLRAQREALRTAEGALREASAVKNLGAEQRQRLNQRLDEVRAQLKAVERRAAPTRRLDGADDQGRREDLRRVEEEMRARQQELRDREQELRDYQQELNDHQREMQDRMRESNRDRADRNRESDDAFVAELLKDGLIEDQDNFQLKLTARSLVVNGKEQSQKVFQKYLKLYERNAGRPMSATGSVQISRNGTTTTNRDNGPQPPRPPRPPRAPRPATGLAVPAAPMAPPALQAPAPPRPPQAPGVDTQTLRDELRNELRNELRKDGLIGRDDKNFQLQLNDTGLTVNGKRQPDALAAKYRQLAGHNDGPGQVHNLSISVQE